MSKFKAFIATILLVPSLAFADQCASYTDQDFRDMLTTGPMTMSIDDSELNMTGTVTAEFHKNGVFDEHVNFTTPLGKGTIDMKANWNITNAVLNFHLVSIKHSDTHNKKLNKQLDDLIKEVKANPDDSVPVADFGLCDGKRSVHSVLPFKAFLK